MNGKLLLRLGGGGTLIFGLIGLFLPGLISNYVGFRSDAASAYSEIRAVFGGLFVMMGAMVLACGTSVRGRAMAHAVMLCFAGMVAGRILSLFLDGFLTLHTYLGLALESAAFFCIYIGLRKSQKELQDRGSVTPEAENTP